MLHRNVGPALHLDLSLINQILNRVNSDPVGVATSEPGAWLRRGLRAELRPSGPTKIARNRGSDETERRKATKEGPGSK